MLENKVVLKDGTEFIGGNASRSTLSGELMVRLPGNQIAGAAGIFSDPEKTETIICYYSIYKVTYTGFTEMYSIAYSSTEDKTILWLKGENVTETREHTVAEEYIPKGL